MLNITVFVENPRIPSETDSQAIMRTKAAAGRFAGQVAFEVLSLDSDQALEMGAAISPTIVVGDIAIAVGQAPLAGQIKRFIEAELEGIA